MSLRASLLRIEISTWRENTFDNSTRQSICLNTNYISWKGSNIIRNVSSLEQNTNDRSKKVNSKHTDETLHIWLSRYMYLNNSTSRNELVTNRKKISFDTTKMIKIDHLERKINVYN